MTENNNLNPNSIDLTAGSANAPLPELTLKAGTAEENIAPTPQLQQTAQKAAIDTSLDESKLSAEEKQLVADFSKKIDLSDSTMVMTYGGTAQHKVAEFSDSALSTVRTKDLGDTGEMILSLVGQLRSFSATEDDNKPFKWFRRQADKLADLKNRYDKVEVSVDKIAAELENHQVQLLKDISIMDKLYQVNLTNFKELTLYIIAGNKALKSARTTTLKELTEKAHKSGLPEDAQAANDYAQLCDRFEKKLHDLELTRMVAIQSAPQIRLIQNNDTIMTEKIQTTIMNTIPLWKSQMLIALGLQHSQQALAAQKAVTDTTNQLLKKNADLLKTGTIAIAKEAERGIVDIETLNYTNQQLISTLDEVLKIQNEGRAKRRSAETELRRIEGELKNKLLDIQTYQSSDAEQQ
ncbi:MAG: toxic anion resistance protein [Clostridiales bacterium]|nr:toxic anion resistance protein [Clostridiales bacterium]